MKQLPVVNLEELKKEATQRRINLANRPRLNVGGGQLSRVSHTLSTKSADRARFLADPTAYLKEQSIDVSSCKLVEGTIAQTAEACTGPVLLCVVAVVVLAVAVAVAVVEVKVTAVVPVSDGVDLMLDLGVAGTGRSPFTYGTSVV